MKVLRQYRDLLERLAAVDAELNRVRFERDRLVDQFDAAVQGYRLPMRLRRRSGGLLAWRNLARNGRDQRDRDLIQYRNEMEELPQSLRQELLRLEKQRILINLNLSLLKHESRQLRHAQEKIAASTTIREPDAVSI